MDIDKLIEEKTECFTGNGDYYFTYVTPEDCKKIVEEALKQGKSLPIDSVSNTISLGRKVVKNGEIGKVIKRCSRGFNWWIVDWNRGTQTEEYGSDLSCC